MDQEQERYAEERHARMQEVLGKVLHDDAAASKRRRGEMDDLRRTVAQTDGLSCFLGATVFVTLAFAAVYLPYTLVGDFSKFEELNVVAAVGAACLLWLLLRRIRG